MKKGWQRVTFGELGRVFNGNSINETEKKVHFQGVTDGAPYIGTKDVSFDHQVLINELGPKFVVGLDTADLCRGDEDVVGTMRRKKVIHRTLIQQVELCPGACNEVAEPADMQAPNEG